MNYTRRQVLLSVREREDGQWRFACWMRDERDGQEVLVPFEHAWKASPLRFDGPGWVVESVLQEALRYVRDVNAHAVDQEESDQLDLWGDV